MGCCRMSITKTVRATMKAGVPCVSGRIYNTDVLQNAIDEALSNDMFVELDSSENIFETTFLSEVVLDKVIGKINSIVIDGEDVFVEFTTFQTPLSEAYKQLLESDVPLIYNLIGFGAVDKNTLEVSEYTIGKMSVYLDRNE